MRPFVQTLHSFGQFEKLVMIRFDLQPVYSPKIDSELNLTMLNSIQLEALCGVGKLTLDTPRLQEVQLVDCLLWQCTLFVVSQVNGLSLMVTDSSGELEEPAVSLRARLLGNRPNVPVQPGAAERAETTIRPCQSEDLWFWCASEWLSGSSDFWL